jgi:succinate-acetate transporter protein
MNKTINSEVKKVDYRSIFFLGFIFNFAGIATVISTRNPAPIGLMAFGIILMINGLMNKDKWYDKNV